MPPAAFCPGCGIDVLANPAAQVSEVRACPQAALDTLPDWDAPASAFPLLVTLACDCGVRVQTVLDPHAFLALPAQDPL